MCGTAWTQLCAYTNTPPFWTPDATPLNHHWTRTQDWSINTLEQWTKFRHRALLLNTSDTVTQQHNIAFHPFSGTMKFLEHQNTNLKHWQCKYFKLFHLIFFVCTLHWFSSLLMWVWMNLAPCSPMNPAPMCHWHIHRMTWVLENVHFGEDCGKPINVAMTFSIGRERKGMWLRS